MKPVDQTKTLDGGERGNCLAACLASLFECKLDDVPALEELPPGAWKIAMAQWASSLGKELIKRDPDQYCPDVHYIAVGLSDRGNRHATIGLNGVVVHDPHSARKGLERVEYVFTLENLTDDLPQIA